MTPSLNSNKTTIESLLVIEELRVGPLRIQSKRIFAPYTILSPGGKVESKELIYAYPEPVFDPKDPVSQNLAAMITAQLALNYGLFCKRIIFDGLFDASDQRFLKEGLENTAREIYVNKLLQPNEFLVGETKKLVFEKRKKYCQAEVSFVNTIFPGKDYHWTYWPSEKNRYCILSSGGKDSLLSYGLIKELGKEVHAVFGNESGRHWFTALNAYRYLRNIDANTTKVWMNSDRLFAWMLRHLPFIRQDFSQVRSDDYPIRLWTVAVFLFGVLPIIRKRRLGHIVIGDEYDTTQRLKYEGITHYNGLFDQSRYFDELLSRYFLKKGWGISQFSILRPLSELLIQKLLTRRYPDLLAHQLSCHAAHEKEGRIYPCGRCEKCHRIIKMLTALDGDPKHCGYSQDQIDLVLQNKVQKKLKQIGPDAGHLNYLLAQKGILPGEKKPTPHHEVMHLRFDKDRSPFHHIPNHIRIPLYKIMLEQAEGVMEKTGKQWHSIAWQEEPRLQIPYPFETYDQSLLSHQSNGQSNPIWGEMTWEEADERLKTIDLAILPVGAIEQHGPHLPLDIDAFDAAYLAQKVAEACQEPKPFVLPLVPYGVSYHHSSFAGTISISNEAMSKFIYDIGISLARNGIKKLVIINGHGDNAPALNYAAQMINRDAHIFVCVDTGETSDADIDRLTKTPNDIHAGEVETSTTLAVRPYLVKMDRAKNVTLRFSNRYLNFSSANSVPWYTYTDRISEDGTMGDPTKATAEKGRRIWEIMIGHLVTLVEELKNMSLEEIFQKKY